MGQDALIGGATFGAAGLKHGRMEPTAVLVSAFEVKVRNAVLGAVFAVTQNECVGRTRVEPNVEHVKDLFVVVRVRIVAEHALFEAVDIPNVGATNLELLSDAGVDRRVAQEEIIGGRQGVFLHKAGQRNAPRALTRENPVRARFDHRIEAVAARLWGPFHQLVDRGQRAFADGFAIGVLTVVHVLINGCEPLRRVAVDNRSLRPPGMRVGVLHLGLTKQRARVGHLFDVRDVCGTLFAIGQDHMHAGKDRQVSAVRGILGHVVGHRQAEFQAELIVVVTVRRRGVNKARTSLFGHVIARQHRNVIVPFAVAVLNTTIRVR